MDIKNQDITFSHLIDDLVNQVCCEVEYEMHKGLDFNEAYKRVSLKLGKRRLKEIQKETLYAVVLPWYTWLTWKEEININARFLFIIIGSVALIVPGALINLNFQYSYEDGFYPHQFQQQAIYKYLSGINNSLLITYEDSSCYKVM